MPKMLESSSIISRFWSKIQPRNTRHPMSTKRLSMIFVEMWRNIQVSVIYHYSVSASLTVVPSASFRLALPIIPHALRMHIIRRTGTPAAQHPSFSHMWFVRDSNRGIAWGVLTTSSIKDLLCVVRWQEVDEEIQCSRYLIGATGEGSARLHQNTEDPLLLRELIFLNRNDDIHA